MTALTEFPSQVNPETSQRDKAREDQVQNNAGGFVFTLDVFDHLKRFLVLGTEGGTYYASQKDHTLQAVKALKDAYSQDGIRAVDTIVEISKAGRAPKNDQALFALAYGASVDDDNVRKYALSKLNEVARTGTHLFQFTEYVQKFRGWGRALRNAVGSWYTDKDSDKLAYQLVKYRQRDGWSHRDLLRLSHPKTDDVGTSALLGITVNDGWKSVGDSPWDIVTGFNIANNATSVDDVVRAIRDYGVTHEMIPSEFKKKVKVWEALLDRGMPTTALVRNLGVMTANGTLKPLSKNIAKVVESLTNPEKIKKSRIHPLNILFAKSTYDSNSEISSALEDAFHLAFDNVVPAGKNTLVALDVSGSMGVPIGNTNLSARDASAAMALVTVKTEPNTHVVGFTGGTGRWSSYSSLTNSRDPLTVLNINKKSTLNSTIDKVSGLPFGGTDCSLPMLYAIENNLDVDTFIIYTDNETWAGNIHPFEALKKYRKHSGRDAKLVVVGMASTGFTIADPSDRGMLDVVGFDTASPGIIADFSAGRI